MKTSQLEQSENNDPKDNSSSITWRSGEHADRSVELDCVVQHADKILKLPQSRSDIQYKITHFPR